MEPTWRRASQAPQQASGVVTGSALLYNSRFTSSTTTCCTIFLLSSPPMLQCHACSAAGRQAALPSRTHEQGNAGGAGTHRVDIIVGGPCRIKATHPSGPRRPYVCPRDLDIGGTVRSISSHQSTVSGWVQRMGQMSRALHVPVEPRTMRANGVNPAAHHATASAQKSNYLRKQRI